MLSAPVVVALLAAGEVRAMTLPQAQAWAREHQPSLAAARARVAAAQAEARVPRATWLPRVALAVELFGGTTNNSTASIVSAPGVELPRIGATKVPDTFSLLPAASTVAALGVRQEIYDFGRSAALAAAADALADAEQSRAELEQLEVALAIEEAFLAVKAAHAVLAAAEGAYQRAVVSRDTARAGVTSGLRKPIELTRAEADLSRADVGRVRAAGGLTAAQALFATVTGAAEPLLEASGDAAGRPEPGPAEEALKRAAEADPAVRAAQAAIEAQRARTRAIAAERRPDLYASAALSGRAGGAAPSSGPTPFGLGWLPVVPNWDVGAVLAWPLLDFTSMARERTSAELEAVRESELQVVTQRLRVTLQSGWATFQTARESVPALERQSAAAQANWAQAHARFDAGLASALELADAEALRTDAEIQLALGQFELARTRARLARLSNEELR